MLKPTVRYIVHTGTQWTSI